MTLKDCQGNPLKAEVVLGWGRQTVALGLAENRSGIICLGAQSAFSGRNRWEEQHRQSAQALRHLADAHAQPDPTFRTSLTYTRLTAQSALQALREQGYSDEELPSPSTMAEVLNRMGYRLRKVVKAQQFPPGPNVPIRPMSAGSLGAPFRPQQSHLTPLAQGKSKRGMIPCNFGLSLG